MQNPYRLIESREAYRARNFRIREDAVQRPNGVVAPFAVIEMKHGSTTLPLDSDGSVYLVREYKYGVGRATLEAASGGIEPNETPLEAAKRELREEVGLIASEWVDFGHVDPFTTQLVSPNHIFLARGLEHVDSDPDEGEVIEVARMPLDEAVAMAMRGEITHAATCVILLKVRLWIGS